MELSIILCIVLLVAFVIAFLVVIYATYQIEQLTNRYEGMLKIKEDTIEIYKGILDESIEKSNLLEESNKILKKNLERQTKIIKSLGEEQFKHE